MNDASCPIFIAAPFIVPSVSTIRSAESSATRSMWSRCLSRPRTSPLAFAPAKRAPSKPARHPTPADRRSRLFGMLRSSESLMVPQVTLPGPMPSTIDTFNALVGELDYPMFIATTVHEDELAGCLVGFATQCSIDPPRFLVCISKANRTFRVVREAPSVAVHFVPEGADKLAALFGGETGDEVDKFSRCTWHPGPGGLPLLEDCQNRFVG